MIHVILFAYLCILSVAYVTLGVYYWCYEPPVDLAERLRMLAP